MWRTVLSERQRKREKGEGAEAPWMQDDSKMYAEVTRRVFDMFKPEEKRTLSSLKDKMAKALKNISAEEKGAFVRLSTRSAKDAVLKSQKIKDIITREIEQSTLDLKTTSEAMVEAEDMRAFVRACSFALKVKTSDEVVEQFVNSTRICSPANPSYSLVFSLLHSCPLMFVSLSLSLCFPTRTLMSPTRSRSPLSQITTSRAWS